MTRALACTCPEDDGTPRDASDFARMAECPLTDEDDRELFQRAALRLDQRARMRAAVYVDPAFVSDDEIRAHHKARLMVCECPICHADEARDEIDDAEEDGFAPSEVH